MKKQEQGDNWISVDDRFVGRAGRARSKAVLVYCPSNICIFTACFNFEEQKWEHFAPGAYDLREKVTHWMPLPEPPEDRMYAIRTTGME